MEFFCFKLRIEKGLWSTKRFFHCQLFFQNHRFLNFDPDISRTISHTKPKANTERWMEFLYFCIAHWFCIRRSSLYLQFWKSSNWRLLSYRLDCLCHLSFHLIAFHKRFELHLSIPSSPFLVSSLRLWLSPRNLHLGKGVLSHPWESQALIIRWLCFWWCLRKAIIHCYHWSNAGQDQQNKLHLHLLKRPIWTYSQLFCIVMKVIGKWQN